MNKNSQKKVIASKRNSYKKFQKKKFSKRITGETSEFANELFRGLLEELIQVLSKELPNELLRATFKGIPRSRFRQTHEEVLGETSGLILGCSLEKKYWEIFIVL